MDSIDRKILFELQRDGRLTNAELADRVQLTPSPCLRRVRQLEKDGIILAYRAFLDRDALGCGFQVFVWIVLCREDRATLDEFEQRLVDLPEVLEAYRLFGEPGYLLRIGVADVDAYERLYVGVLTRLPGVATLTSHVTMKEVKSYEGIPVEDRARR